MRSRKSAMIFFTMWIRWFFLALRLPLFSLASSAAIVLAAPAQTILYQINADQRGTEIINSFNSLPHAGANQVPEFALQTTLAPSSFMTYKYIVNGIIPYIQGISPTIYNTLLVVSYIAPQAPGVTQYIVLPSEQVSAALYFPKTSNLPTSSAAFSWSVPNGTIPFFAVDPKQRAADIASAISQLIKLKASNSQIWVQTSLSGPFNPPLAGGLMKNVSSATVNNSLITFQYQPPSQQVLTLIAAPEQVQQITFILNLNNP